MSVEIYTLGCRLNSAESEMLRSQARASHWNNTTIINSCAVTREAIRQTRQTIRRANKNHPHHKILLTGCAATIHPKMFQSMPEIHRVIPNAQKLSFVNNDSAPLATTRVRAFLPIQTGCDHHCTFCITRIARGKSQSHPPREIIKNAQSLLKSGARELILTGVDIASYRHGATRLGSLARLLLRALPQLPRLRLSSLDPAAIDSALLALIAEEDRLMPHLHLSIQSGDDLILKRMRRRHGREEIITLAQTLRRLRPDIALTADLIAGFPTETDAMFQNTRGIIKECRLASAHIFPFSPHPETPAAKMPQWPKELIHDRARLLREDASRARLRHLRSLHGKTLPCLMETSWRGKTPSYVSVESEESHRAGEIVALRLMRKGDRLTGRSL